MSEKSKAGGRLRRKLPKGTWPHVHTLEPRESQPGVGKGKAKRTPRGIKVRRIAMEATVEEDRLKAHYMVDWRLKAKYTQLLVGKTTTAPLYNGTGDAIVLPPGVVITEEVIKSLTVELIAHITVVDSAMVEDKTARLWNTKRNIDVEAERKKKAWRR
jgi:hypothetical protein